MSNLKTVETYQINSKSNLANPNSNIYETKNQQQSQTQSTSQENLQLIDEGNLSSQHNCRTDVPGPGLHG